MVEPQLGGTYGELLQLARWAERNGFVSFTRSDHYYSSRRPAPSATDAFATLAGLARETSHIRLCVLVTPVTFRHPAVIAKTAATIDQMSGGRLDLGVGTGWMELEHDAFGLPFPPWSERFQRLEETLQYLDAAFSPESPTFNGDFYSLDADSHPKPDSRIPIIVGGSGPKRTPGVAGRYAAEYNHFIAPPHRLAERLTTMRAAALDAGRDPDSIVYSTVSTVVTGPSESEYRENLATAAAERAMDPSALEARLEEVGSLHGPAERLAEQLDALSAAGVSKLYVQFLGTPSIDEVASVWQVIHG